MIVITKRITSTSVFFQKNIPFLYIILKGIRYQIRRFTAYYQDQTGWFGIITFNTYLQFILTESNPNIYAIQTRLFLESNKLFRSFCKKNQT